VLEKIRQSYRPVSVCNRELTRSHSPLAQWLNSRAVGLMWDRGLSPTHWPIF